MKNAEIFREHVVRKFGGREETTDADRIYKYIGKMEILLSDDLVNIILN